MVVLSGGGGRDQIEGYARGMLASGPETIHRTERKTGLGKERAAGKFFVGEIGDFLKRQSVFYGIFL